MPKKLKEHRIGRMLTYRDLAEASGCAVTTLMAVERGVRKPHFATMVAVAGAIAVDVPDIAEFAVALDFKTKDAA